MSARRAGLQARAASSVRAGLHTVGAASRSGLLAPVRPDRLVRMAVAPLRLGAGLATLVAVAAARHADHPAITDERGCLSYGELDARSARIAAALRHDLGLREGRSLAVMCRNHRGFVEAAAAGARCGADLLFVNTELPAAQLEQVLDRARPTVIVHDGEFTDRFDTAGAAQRVTGWHDGAASEPTLDDLAARTTARPPASRRQGKIVLLTSGTTGTPKSAPRSPTGLAMLEPAAALFWQIPFRAREQILIGPPLFHGFGLAFLAVGLFLGSTVVVRRRFDAEAALAAIDHDRITTVVGVPVMLQRLLDARTATAPDYDCDSVRLVISAAAPLGSRLSSSFMDVFGDVLYNIYGTTETGFGAIATPQDLRAAPGTAGLPPDGVTLRILDDDRVEVAPGRSGHVFMGGSLLFEGYTGEATKETLDGLMNTGDLGHVDARGRLFIDGREDDMIVSGGENVFPLEVEDVLRGHDAVADVVVVGAEDQEFGQRLRAFVVRRPGTEVTGKQLEDHVRTRLERYKVPREIVFLDELPRNATGKVLRAGLPAAARG